MGKVIMVVLLSLSTLMPVFSEESHLDDKVITIVDEKVEEEKEVRELVINKKSYDLDVYSRKQLSIDSYSEGGQLSFISLDPKIVSVDDEGFMVASSPGKTSIEVRLSFPEEDDLLETISVQVLQDDGLINFKESEFFLIRDLYFDVEYSLEGNIKPQELIWESSNPSVAGVENGRVNGLKIGTTRITASAKDVSASMEVTVTAPLKGLAFNPDKIEMIIGEEKELPSIVYAPYDTTTAKNPIFSINDDEVVVLDGTVLQAQKVGETKVFAKINDIVTELSIIVRPDKNSRDADVLTLMIESQDEDQITFRNPDLSLYQNNYFSLHLPVEETLAFLEDKKTADILIVLDDILYAEDMKAIDEMMIEQEIVALFEGKDIRIHLLNKDNIPEIVYEFSHGSENNINLKYNVNELVENDELFSLVQTQAYHLFFDNNEGFPEKTVAKVPAKATGSHYKLLHFVYEVKDQELSDTNQELTIDSQDYLNIDLTGDNYLITLSKVSNVNDSKVIVTLSVILFISLLSGVLFYYYKAHNKD